MSRMTPGPWYTDGVIVWARSAAGPAICQSRPLEAREGSLAPVEDPEERRANMAGVAALPAVVQALREWLALADRSLALYQVEPHPDEKPVLEKARAALALLDTPAAAP